jgi:HAD superfamily hydrolase (TIGR01509 family)
MPQFGLILDLDDTLYPRDRYVRSGLAAVAHHVAARLGLDASLVFATMTRATVLEHPRAALQAAIRAYGLSTDCVAELVDVFRAHTPELWLSHGVAGTLAHMRGDGWRTVILTNGLPAVQAHKIAALRLASLVDAIVFAEDTVSGGKPSADAFTAALGALGTEPSQTVCVGDDPRCDVAGARALGIHTVRLARPGAVPDGPDADAVIEAFTALPGAAASLVQMVVAHAA